MKIIASIQARYNSARLPGKVLLPIAGKSSLERIYERLLTCRELDGVVIAAGEDGCVPIMRHAREKGLRIITGSEDDLIARHRYACSAMQADAFVRITADCPLVSPEIVDQCCALLSARYAHGVDFVSNTIRRTYPDGLDVEVVSMRLLARLDATPGVDREAFCRWFIQNGPEEQMYNLLNNEDLSDVRLTLDAEDDRKKIENLLTKCWEHARWSDYAAASDRLGYLRVPSKDHIVRRA